jgi:hypothetical protein
MHGREGHIANIAGLEIERAHLTDAPTTPMRA